MPLKIEELTVQDIDNLKRELAGCSVRSLGGYESTFRIFAGLNELRDRKVREMEERGELD